MNRIRRAWRSLGRARQLITLVLGALCALQAVLFLVTGLAFLLPIVGVLGLLGLVAIKQSAVTRDSLTRLTSGSNEMVRTHKAMQKRLVEIERIQQNSGRALALVREHVGRTGAQFDWLADKAITTQLSLDRLERNTEALDSAMSTQHVRGTELQREIAAQGATIVEAISGTATQFEGALSPIKDELAAAVAAVATVDRQVSLAFDGGNSHSLERRIVAELSAMSLLHGANSGAALPPFEGWSMAPSAVQFAQSVVADLGSEHTIVELGSGVSTAWLAYSLSQRSNPPRLVSIDHDSAFGSTTDRLIAKLDVGTAAEVIIAPLERVTLDGVVRQWYGTDWISGVSNIGLLVVDGPPAGKDHGARYPALPMLVDHLADEAVILVDDADRPGESSMIAEWMKITGIRRMGMVGRSLILKFSRAEGASK